MSFDAKRINFGSSSDSDDEASLVVTSLSRTLEGGPPWGFRFIGGSDVGQRIKVIRVRQIQSQSLLEHNFEEEIEHIEIT